VQSSFLLALPVFLAATLVPYRLLGFSLEHPAFEELEALRVTVRLGFS
jgi:hypothetical protein